MHSAAGGSHTVAGQPYRLLQTAQAGLNMLLNEGKMGKFRVAGVHNKEEGMKYDYFIIKIYDRRLTICCKVL